MFVRSPMRMLLLSPPGTHSAKMGSGNYTIMLDPDYIELLGILADRYGRREHACHGPGQGTRSPGLVTGGSGC